MTEITTAFRNGILGLLVVTGALNTLAYKYQNKQLVFEGAYYKYFFHPYMQATTMFVGEFLCMALYLIMKRRDPDSFRMRALEAKSKGKKSDMNPLLLAIPAFCDCLTSTMQYIALNFISGSVYQMLRGGVIVTTAILSKFVLKMQLKRNHYTGCLIAIIGILLVGVSNVVFAPHSSSSDTDSKLVIIGYILIIASLFTNGLFFVSEEKLYQAYHLEPMQVVGYQGLFGLVFYAIILPIISFVPCTFGVEACVFSDKNFPYIERPGQYFAEAAGSWSLMLFVILGVFSIAAFNVCGSTVTKYINALARSLADVTRTIVIWLVGIIVTVTAGRNYPNYVWEIVGVGAILLELAGFVILVFGNMIYNRMIVVPALSGPEEKKQDLTDDSDYNVSLQPNAKDNAE